MLIKSLSFIRNIHGGLVCYGSLWSSVIVNELAVFVPDVAMGFITISETFRVILRIFEGL